MFGSRSSHKFEVSYIFQNDPHAQIVESDQDTLSRSDAARHLLAHHKAEAGDAPITSESDADELLRQAEALGITDIRVTRLVHEHEPGTTPGHYQQP